MRQLFLTGSRQQPVVLAVENLQWIDPTSEALLASLVDGLAGAPILVLETFRPGYRPRWLDKSYATQIALQPLGPDESRRVVRHVVPDIALSPALEQQMVSRAEGNPFFLEELAYTVREHGEGHTALAVPDTIHAVLAARMDRLPTPEKHLLQVASVIGKDIPVPLLHAVAALPEEALNRRLAQLQTAEFLAVAGRPPTGSYTFRHILIQETAYQALPSSTRRQYHQRIAQALAEHFPALSASQPALLAHHYTQAGCTKLAFAAWRRAGQQAAERSAHVEAIAHLTQAVALLQTLPGTPERNQQEIELQLALGPSVVATKGPAAPEAAEPYARARALCTQVGDTPQMFPILWGLWRFYRGRGELSTARELGEQLLWLAQREAKPTHLLEAHAALGDTLFVQGEYAAARTHLEQGIAFMDPAEERTLALRHAVTPGVTCLAYAALSLWCLGYPAQALRRSQETLTLAQALDHPHSLAFAQQWAVALHHRRREAPAVETQADALLPLATTQGFPFWVGFGACWRGWRLAMRGECEEALAQLHHGLTTVVATGQTLSQPVCLVLLAEAAGHAGQVVEGLHQAGEALGAFEASGRGDMLTEAYRLRGELLLRQAVPDTAQAEACFQQALAIARRQQAKSWELRVAVILSHLWQCQAKRTQARQLLAEVYGWFTEGFDTADLQEARGLLAEICC